MVILYVIFLDILTMAQSSSKSRSVFFLFPPTEEINSNNVKILLTNARLLSPKIELLHEYFSELDLSVALVTESWLSDGAVLDADVADLETETSHLIQE